MSETGRTKITAYMHATGFNIDVSETYEVIGSRGGLSVRFSAKAPSLNLNSGVELEANESPEGAYPDAGSAIVAALNKWGVSN